MYAPWVFASFFAGVAFETFLPGIRAIWFASVAAAGLACFLAIQSKRFLVLAFFAVGFAIGLWRARVGAFDVPVEHVRTILESARDVFVSGIRHALPEPHASYLAGVLVGVRSSIPWDLRRAFQVTGTSHLIALSGYNVTVIAEYMRSITTRIWFPILGITLFALGTGASSSVIRASIMAVALLFVRSAGYEYDVRRSLLLASFVMVFADPGILFGDIGFQLSVAATFGIAELAPRIERRARFLPAAFHVRESFATTIAAQAATAPLILWYFGFLSLIAPVVNVLVLPTMPPLMALGFIGGLGGMLGGIGRVLALPAYALLDYQLRVITFFARVYGV